MDREAQERATVSVWLRQGFTLSPSARTGLADLAPRAKVGQTVGCSTFTHGAKPATQEGGRRREDEPPGRGGAYAPIPGDDEHQGDEDLENCPHPGLAAPGPRYLWARRP